MLIDIVNFLVGGKSAARYKEEHLASLELDRVQRVARFARGNVRLQSAANPHKVAAASIDNYHERAERIERLKRDLRRL